MEHFKASMLELIVQTSTNLPPDVRAAMAEAATRETRETQAGSAMEVIATNIDMASDCSGAIC